MGLKTEQKLRNCQFAEKQPRIYSTGVYLVPMKISICGIDQFLWVADDFNDDIFDSNGNNISAKLIAETIEDLL